MRIVQGRHPQHLSGGERQRIGIARALLTSPQLLLMDEPLAALDSKRKNEILPYLERLHDELDIPVLYVSHAQDEVARLADHIVLLSDGQVLASGPIGETLARLDLPMAWVPLPAVNGFSTFIGLLGDTFTHMMLYVAPFIAVLLFLGRTG